MHWSGPSVLSPRHAASLYFSQKFQIYSLIITGFLEKKKYEIRLVRSTSQLQLWYLYPALLRCGEVPLQKIQLFNLCRIASYLFIRYNQFSHSLLLQCIFHLHIKLQCGTETLPYFSSQTQCCASAKISATRHLCISSKQTHRWAPWVIAFTPVRANINQCMFTVWIVYA